MSQQIKTIAIVINTSWNIYNFRVGLLQSLQEEGYRIVAIAPHDSYSQKLEALGFEYHNIDINNKGTNPFEDIKLIWEFYQLYKRIEPDILLHYTIKPNIYGMIAAAYLGIPTINNIAGLGTLFTDEGLVTKIAKKLYKFSQGKASHIFFQNTDDFDLFTEEKLVDALKCSVLPGSGVDTTKFKPIQIGKNDEKFRFLLIARMLWDKGIREYVNAAKILMEKHQNKSLEFQLLGFLDVVNPNAITKEQMEEWVNTKLVNYLGVTDNVKDFIARADCVVLPSFYREGVPRTLLEAASMAKPIITTSGVGCKEVVDDGVNGFLCKVKDVNDLVMQMEKMIQLEGNQRIQMGKNGREKVIKEFDESIVIVSYKTAIKNILH